MGADVFGEDTLHLARGRRLFREGAPWPEWKEGDRKAIAVWVGYHAARATAFFERRRVKELLGAPES